jgi:RNAse (barnase) inhibitor barstar
MNSIEDVEKLFLHKINPGIYLLKSNALVAEISSLSAIHNFRFFYIDGEDIRSKETFLKKAGEVFGFPDYYGRNWDAFEECIKDFEWYPAEGCLILYDHFEVFAAYASGEFKVALTIFGSAIKYWEENNRITFYVLLRDNGNIAPNLDVENLSSVL